MKIHEVKTLISTYGEDATLSDVLKIVQGNKIHRCPKCKGAGKVSIRYNAYPSGLPDSGWVQDWKYKDIDCDLCGGEGYTEREYRPRMVQDGWE